MQRLPTYPIRHLLIASAAMLVSSCGGQVKSMPAPPASLFARQAEPAIPPAAATSEAAYLGWRRDHADWGRTVAAALDNACLWFRDAGYKVECR